MQNCYRTPVFSGIPNQRGTKSEVATSPLPSQGPKGGRNCYVTPAFSWVPNTKPGDQFKSGYPNPAFLGAQKRAELLRNPYILGGPQHQVRGQNQNWLPRPYLLGAPKEGGIAT